MQGAEPHPNKQRQPRRSRSASRAEDNPTTTLAVWRTRASLGQAVQPSRRNMTTAAALEGGRIQVIAPRGYSVW